MKQSVLIISLFIISNFLFAQHSSLSGTIEISIQNGTLDGEFTITDIPNVENYRIALNSGLNIVYIKDQENRNINYKKQYDSKISYESFLYYFPSRNKDSISLPNHIKFKFTGKYPVHNDTINLNDYGDWKGNIAFSDNTLRMDGTQSSWYPILYDLDKDIRYSKVNYSIEILCNDCDALYLNGNDPVYASNYIFKSKSPTDISLFVGRYNFYFVNNNWYLNPDIDKEEMIEFSNITEQFKNYFSNKLGIPYQGTIKFIQTAPTSKKNSFLFVDYPTIINIDRGADEGLKGLISEEYPEDKAYLAHELAHYYFGSGSKTFNSPLVNPICEGFSEFLSLKVAKDILGTKVYDNIKEEIILNLQKNEFYKPISKINSFNDLKDSNSYSYLYFPVILLAIENEIGEIKMWNWMKNILITETDFTDYVFLKECLVKNISNIKESDRIIEKYFQSDNSLNNALNQINK